MTSALCMACLPPGPQCLFVDVKNNLLVAAMLDKCCYVYDLDDPIPR